MSRSMCFIALALSFGWRGSPGEWMVWAWATLWYHRWFRPRCAEQEGPEPAADDTHSLIHHIQRERGVTVTWVASCGTIPYFGTLVAACREATDALNAVSNLLKLSSKQGQHMLEWLPAYNKVQSLASVS